MGGFFSQIGELYVVHHLWGKRVHLTHPTLAPHHLVHPKPHTPFPRGCRGGVRNKVSLLAAYKDLQSREETRNAAWRKRGWDENVYYTGEHRGLGLSLSLWQSCKVTPPPLCFAVPLIRTMESRIMIPLKISPLQ